MGKLRLDVEKLDVVSFEIKGEDGSGTVRAHTGGELCVQCGDSEDSCGGEAPTFTCTQNNEYTCQNPCGLTEITQCGSCVYTCALTCGYCCGAPNTVCRATCQGPTCPGF